MALPVRPEGWTKVLSPVVLAVLLWVLIRSLDPCTLILASIPIDQSIPDCPSYVRILFGTFRSFSILLLLEGILLIIWEIVAKTFHFKKASDIKLIFYFLVPLGLEIPLTMWSIILFYWGNPFR